MKIYLTSDIGGYYEKCGNKIPTFLNYENGFVGSLKKNWKNNSDILIISADPDAYFENDNTKNIFEASFLMSGLSINKIALCDNRNLEIIQEIKNFDVIILLGGHVPTQNKFFKKIYLKDKLKYFDGIIIGISAGSMNCAENVYAHPELDGEAIDESYKRFISGLGLSKINILPHYQYSKNLVLDGKRIFEDIAYPDSYGNEFFAIVDGSYILIEKDKAAIFGEAYLIKNGVIEQICKINECIEWLA